ncbi:hypothetical protein [Microbacterium terrisoli]|jgi:hypothetical protein|uniref:hypothetical protein n=1 Tax=Microbacterium terrisoli TaxID=3242192 RepID=UPI0028059D00|nr:hypothetical protein [Microbacterium protaetiae]
MRIYDHPLPIVWDDSPRARRTDPIESHIAADVSGGKRVPQKIAVARALEAAGHPITADEVFRLARRMGLYCTRERVRTILAEHRHSEDPEKQGEYGSEFVAVSGGRSALGNAAQLWALREDKQ